MQLFSCGIDKLEYGTTVILVIIFQLLGFPSWVLHWMISYAQHVITIATLANRLNVTEVIWKIEKKWLMAFFYTRQICFWGKKCQRGYHAFNPAQVKSWILNSEGKIAKKPNRLSCLHNKLTQSIFKVNKFWVIRNNTGLFHKSTGYYKKKKTGFNLLNSAPYMNGIFEIWNFMFWLSVVPHSKPHEVFTVEKKIRAVNPVSGDRLYVHFSHIVTVVCVIFEKIS